jgi:hypothetical protein
MVCLIHTPLLTYPHSRVYLATAQQTVLTVDPRWRQEEQTSTTTHIVRALLGAYTRTQTNRLPSLRSLVPLSLLSHQLLDNLEPVASTMTLIVGISPPSDDVSYGASHLTLNQARLDSFAFILTSLTQKRAAASPTSAGKLLPRADLSQMSGAMWSNAIVGVVTEEALLGCMVSL